MNSAVLDGLEIVSRGKARRAKLFYLRNRIGKMALYVRPLPQKKAFGKKNSKNKKDVAVNESKDQVDLKNPPASLKD